MYQSPCSGRFISGVRAPPWSSWNFITLPEIKDFGQTECRQDQKTTEGLYGNNNKGWTHYDFQFHKIVCDKKTSSATQDKTYPDEVDGIA